MDIPLTIKDTQAGLLKKQFSVVDLVDAYFARIKKYNKEINAFLTLCEDKAYETAKKADKQIADFGQKAFNDFPLLGVIVGHKDLFLTKGIRTTASSKVLEDYVPAYSGTVVERLEKAGAVVIGKLNCDAWAHGASGENSDFGPCKNPWNHNFVPGGSSSGSAASIAANFCLISTGTDTGGSIRQPANFCGVYGLKPTYGTVSRYGIIAMASSLDCPGHFARSVDDIERVLKVTKGKDGFDSTLVDYELTPPKPKLRIGVPKEYFIKGIDPEVEANVLKAAEVFKKKGIELVDISLPHTKYGISVYYIIQPAEVSSNLGRYDGVRFGLKREAFSPEAKRRIMLGTYVLSSGYYDAYYLKAMKVRSRVIEDFDKAFEKVDAIIAPVSPTKAFRFNEKAQDPLKMYLADVFTVSANLAGLPGLSIPFGLGKDNLPLGFQLIGSRFSEKTLFELARAFEEATNYQPRVAI
jgi:aspartyl-tRNA(Asn)/glutamyl-tRNA(Gln) amidotransferase subunit A